jgi:hypothetical protein
MNPIVRISIFTALSMMLICLIAWLKGNENIYVYDEKKMVNPKELSSKDVEDFKPYYYDYYRTYTIAKTKTPSVIPGIFDSKYDTVSVVITDEYRN